MSETGLSSAYPQSRMVIPLPPFSKVENLLEPEIFNEARKFTGSVQQSAFEINNIRKNRLCHRSIILVMFVDSIELVVFMVLLDGIDGRGVDG